MSLRLLLLSDPHFGCENAPAVEATVAAAAAFAPDLTVVAGDLTHAGRTNEFLAARSWLARLPRPRIVTPGNHDTPLWNVALRLFAPFGRFRDHVGGSIDSIDLPGLSAHSLNTARGVQPRLDWSKGSIRLSGVRAAIDGMRRAPGALKVLVCHHPLVESHGGAVGGAVRRGAVAARLLAEAGVDLVLSGHVHEPFAAALPWGDGRSYAVGAGTLSRRTRGAPASFSTIEADDAAICVAVEQWTGAGFTRELERDLRRRPPAAYLGEPETFPGPSGLNGLAPSPIRPRVPEQS